MRTMRSGTARLALLAACLVGSAAAQSGAGGYYNPQTEIAAQGTVEKVENVASGRGWYGVHLMLKAQNRTYDVRLGPSDFIAQNKFTFAPGDPIEVWGSQIGAGDSGILVARAVEKNGQTLTLRDANGFPAWAGMGMRGGYGRGCCCGRRGYGRGCNGCGCPHCGCGCRGGCSN